MIALLCSAGGVAANAAGDSGATTIGGHVYRFPDAAFIDGIPERGAQRQILLKLELPQRLTTGEPPENSLLVFGTGPLPGRGEAATQLADALTQEAHTQASSHVGDDHLPLRAAPNPAAIVPDGFTAVQTDPAHPTGNDVFVRPNVRHPSEVVSCTRRDPALAIARPDCTDAFVWHDVLWKITLARGHLAQWAAVHAVVIHYLSAHEAFP